MYILSALRALSDAFQGRFIGAQPFQAIACEHDHMLRN